METLTFITNIKCMGCVATVTPFLDAKLGQGNWEVDIHHPDKLLRVPKKSVLAEKEIIAAVQDAGYHAEKLTRHDQQNVK